MSARTQRRGLAAWLIRFWRDPRGSISPMLVMGLVPLIGALSMGVEASNWWLTQRTMQNAADSAAIAAATNGSNNDATGTADCTTVDGWCTEARAVAATYGFTNGSAHVVVSAADKLACPSPLTVTDCFQVVITKKVPIRLLNVVGFTGDTVISGQHYVTVKASAMAYATGGVVPPFCVVALGTSAKKDLIVNGGPNSNLPGCSVGSNGDVTCNGHAIGGTIASYGASGDQNDCADNGNNQTEKALITDPYTSQAADIPSFASKCGSTFFQETKHGPALPASNLLSGTLATGTTIICGDAQMTGAVTMPSGSILEVVDGQLDTNGFQLTGTGVNGATIIFTAPATQPNGFTPNQQFITGGGTIDVNAPPGTWTAATSSWTGFAVYQDPNNIPENSITYAGNSPTIEVNGLLYTPNGDITISGDIGSANACVGFLALTFHINGTGNVIDATNCDPVNLSGEKFLQGRVALVQ